MIKSFRDLVVYKHAIDLTVEVDKLLMSFPKDQKYHLVDQMRRASQAIAPLIAEGYAKRSSVKTFQKYLKDAVGEANEMMAHIELSDKLGFMRNKSKVVELIERYDVLGKKLSNLKDNWRNYKQ